MTTQRDIEQALDHWLADGPIEIADRVVDSALETIDQTPQVRVPRLRWRNDQMPLFLKLAASAAAVVALVFAGSLLLNRETGGSGAVPSPAPTRGEVQSSAASPSPTPLGSLATASFTSVRYGYTISLPSELDTQPAAEDWLPGTVVSTTSPSLDKFFGSSTDTTFPNGFLGMASGELPAGLSADTWMTGHAEKNRAAFGEACGGNVDDWVPTIVLGKSGRRVAVMCEGGAVSEVVFTHSGRAWVITGDTILVDFILQSLVLPN